MRYDPSKYETVEQRLKRVYADNPFIFIHTEIVWHNEDFTGICFKASIVESGEVIATGFAYDWKSKDKGATTTNWVETAETSAVGRAIANSKHQDPSAMRPSREEMELASARDAAPVPPVKEPTKPAPAKPAPAKPAPVKAEGLMDKVGTVVKGKEDKVNALLLARGAIQPNQTWEDITQQYAMNIVEHPDKFLALVIAHHANK